MPSAYFLNVNGICNERCVFCAAGLADGPAASAGRPRGVTLADVEDWTAGRPPVAGDEVSVAGGEPTLHPQLLPMLRALSRGGARPVLFTNGLRLADPAYARAVVAAGVGRIEIALFGAVAATHEGVTRRRGSFERTLQALGVLGGLRAEADFVLEVRLLVARQTYRENPAVVRLVADRLTGVDAISINRLILSTDAAVADATVSWGEARASINETARLVLRHGYELGFEALPLCVYEGDVADHVRERLAVRRAAGLTRQPPLAYLDPRSASGEPVGELRAPLGLPRACRACDLLAFCGRVEEWYLDRFGAADLRPVAPAAAAAPAGT